MVFLKILTSLHTRLAAETHLADGELLQVAANRKEFLKLRGRSRMPVVSTREGQHFKPEETEIKKCIK
jgi:hypothetical protein